LNLVLGLGNILEQPLPLAATTNEIYKHAKRLGYGEHDISAVARCFKVKKGKGKADVGV